MQHKTDDINRMATITDALFGSVIAELELGQCDHINQTITLSVIILNSFDRI
jgi:hypothetical protein